MSRRPRSENQFGSDSFLDIVCNVVGILIILMVVAGVRASRMPVTLPAAAIEEMPPVPVAGPDMPLPTDTLPEPVAAAEPEEIEPAPVPVAESVVPPAAAMPDPLPPPPPVTPPEELVTAARTLQRDLQQITQATGRTQQQLEQAQRLQESLQARLQTLQKQQDQQQSRIGEIQHSRAATAAELEQLKQLAAQLQKMIAEQAGQQPNSKTLQHRITPIGQVVTGQELHFRLVNDRVTVVPLDTLIERLKNQIERHKNWLAKSNQQLGQVGPIDGFTMHYVVERDSGSLVDELRMGPGVFRISVSEWQLEIDRSVVGETAEEALRPGSRFAAAVTAAAPGSAMTFWVYPDSFSIYCRLKEQCQQQNFLIAGRPLPNGIPIAGSPTGSRSTGQ